MTKQPRRKGDRSIDFLECRAVIFFVSSLVEVGFLNCINCCNPVPCGTRNHPDEASEKFASLQTDSGLQLDLEIALSGVPAKIQPRRLLQSGRRYVETSGDVISGILKQLGRLSSGILPFGWSKHYSTLASNSKNALNSSSGWAMNRATFTNHWLSAAK